MIELIVEAGAIDTLATGTVAIHKVTSLTSKLETSV